MPNDKNAENELEFRGCALRFCMVMRRVDLYYCRQDTGSFGAAHILVISYYSIACRVSGVGPGRARTCTQLQSIRGSHTSCWHAHWKHKRAHICNFPPFSPISPRGLPRVATRDQYTIACINRAILVGGLV